MNSPLTESWHKLRRARQHLDTLKAQMAVIDFNSTPLFTIRTELSPERRHISVRVDTVFSVPEDWSLLIGDFLNNSRSALDYLAWQLVLRGQTPNPRWPMKVAFPISEGKASFETELGTALPGVHLKPLVAIIRKHQPYIPIVQSSNAWEYGNALLALKRLNNADKHRELRPFATYPVTSPFPGFGFGLIRQTDWENSGFEAGDDLDTVLTLGFQPNAELFELFGKATGPNPYVEIAYDGNAVFVVEEAGRRYFVPEGLDTIAAVVGDILSEIEPLLTT